jgi:hypothetical protein
MVHSGDPTFQSSIAPAADNADQYAALNYNKGDAAVGRNDSVRVIAAGFEVTNTTAPLNKQGSLTAYRRSWTHTNSGANLNLVAGTQDSSLFSIDFYGGLPSSEEDAYNIPGSRQWAAEEGAYVTCALSELENNFNLPNSNPVMVGRMNPNQNSTTADLMALGQVSMPRPVLAATFMEPWGTHRPTNMALSGTYLTGLSAETTITVTLKAYLEIRPGMASPFLEIMSKPTKYDAIALDTYFATLPTMPPGVPRHMNDMGDWLRMAETAARVAVPVVRAVKNNVNQRRERRAARVPATTQTQVPAAPRRRRRG